MQSRYCEAVFNSGYWRMIRELVLNSFTVNHSYLHILSTEDVLQWLKLFCSGNWREDMMQKILLLLFYSVCVLQMIMWY